ncbi:MAG: hypothetical protein ACYS0I_12635 [Planctomycetota bacterium]|jgi:hypothetical protein
MNKILKMNKNNLTLKILLLMIVAIMLTGLSGCLGSYGKVKRDPELTKAIKSNQVTEGYKYYYYGDKDMPYAIAGIEPKYEVRSRLWREVDPHTDQFKKMIYWMWEDYGYYTYGAHILDPSGAKAGIWYSSLYFVTVKFTADNRVVLMPEKPFLWGPTADAGSLDRFSGSMK